MSASATPERRQPPPPLGFIYEGQGNWGPATKWVASRSDGYYQIGTTYVLVEHSMRSTRSHNHYFASLHEMWSTLPEEHSKTYPTPEHLRKKALIATGWATHTDYPCDTSRDAIMLAGILAIKDEYCIVKISSDTVRCFSAMSQDYRSMNKEEFQRSKDDVLGFVSKLLGTQPGETT